MSLAVLMMCGEILSGHDLTAHCPEKSFEQTTDHKGRFVINCEWGTFRWKGMLYAFKVDPKTKKAEGRCPKSAVFWKQ